jgi:hypothetical protein
LIASSAWVIMMGINQVQRIIVPEQERASRIPSAKTVGAAVSIIQRDGIVVLEDVVDKAALAKLNSVLAERSEEIARNPATHFNQSKATRNISQPPPVTPDLMFQSVWANSFTAAISAAILGPSPRVQYANGNTALSRRHLCHKRRHRSVGWKSSKHQSQ